ncbi:MAG: ribose ABC transporter substrate-binding protein [Candidatus Lumbricidophila eiseniae]|uniref:Ribose ABC transporter substrate-binding protein n=1 Tax=Candidatus Lumbricidiphila eiseniae TaxID=1969409 RepID=A0A2A6FSP6_9MICO|nr:MAG: ribose ABC transporter substrate-binding protein [Candidatus Lumbricidophila eiseniae]
MKRTKTVLTAVVLGTVMSLAVSGCTQSGGSGSGGAKQPTLAFIQGVAGDEFYISMECGIKAAATAAGAKVTVQGPTKFDPTLQKPIVDSVVASKPDAILVAPTDVAAMQAPLKAAAAAGIKIVLVDTTVNDPSFAVSQISSDNSGGGVAAFQAIQKAHPNGGKVLVISTDPGVSTSDARAAGFKSAVEKDRSFTFLGIQYSNNQPAKAAEIVTAALQKDPDIVGIFAANLFSAEGTATGVQQAGMGGKLTIVGFDAGPAQVEQLKKGTVQALVAQEPAAIGKAGVTQALAALNKQQVTAKIQTGFTIITKDNVDGDAKSAIYRSSCG